MKNNHYSKRHDFYLKEIIASFGDRPIRWSEVATQFNDKQHKRSQRTAAGLQTRWRTLQKKAKQESLKRIAQKDGFETWFVRFFVSVEKLREQVRTTEAEKDDLRKTNRILVGERDNAVNALEDHLDKDERIRDEAKRLAQTARAVSGD